MNGLQRAIKKAGTQKKLGILIGASQQRISYWLKTGKVTDGFVLPIETSTGVPRHDIRPDIYPIEKTS